MPNVPELLEKAGILKPTKPKRIRKGDIVQITDELHEWYPALVIVERLHAASVDSYIPASALYGAMELSLSVEQFELVGTAKIVRVLTPPQKEETMTATISRIYLMSARKNWHHELPDGWKEVAWERFDYVECGVFEKPVSELTENDNDMWIKDHAEEPEGWIQPGPTTERKTP